MTCFSNQTMLSSVVYFIAWLALFNPNFLSYRKENPSKFLICCSYIWGYIFHNWVNVVGRVPQGQFQSQNKGQKVILPKSTLIHQKMPYLDYLCLQLSRNTWFLKIGPTVAKIQSIKVWRPRPFLQKSEKLSWRYLGNRRSDEDEI